MQSFHKSVLLQESIELLNIKPGKKYIDATLGGGGHTEEILQRGGFVLGIDVDQDAIDFVKEKFKVQSSKFKVDRELILVRGNFKDIVQIARLHNFDRVWGILFDLGVSSFQFEQGSRGFSFVKDAHLDMRMDRRLNIKASDLIKALTKGELYELFHTLGEERYARIIANSIAESRRIKPIETTRDLAALIERAVPNKGAIHPATRVFQALRIAVNDELNSLKEALGQAFSLLDNNGRLVVITFHSLEDRIVKNEFKKFSQEGKGKIINKKPIIPSWEEIKENRRARSAKLRAIEKIG